MRCNTTFLQKKDDAITTARARDIAEARHGAQRSGPRLKAALIRHYSQGTVTVKLNCIDALRFRRIRSVESTTPLPAGPCSDVSVPSASAGHPMNLDVPVGQLRKNRCSVDTMKDFKVRIDLAHGTVGWKLQTRSRVRGGCTRESFEISLCSPCHSPCKRR